MDISTIKKVAHLARIELNDEQAPAVAEQLTKIITLVEQLQQVDTDNIEPMSHPLNLTQRLRDDVVSETNQRDAFQKIAPATEAGLYLVPKVIDIVE